MKVKVLTFISLLALAAPAAAGGFDHYDKNSDGVISADELGEKKAKKMAKLDANGDEVITRDEFEDYKAKKKRSKKTY